jgi:hypothetical protein
MAVVPAAERRCVDVLIDRSETLQLLRPIDDRAFDSARVYTRPLARAVLYMLVVFE